MPACTILYTVIGITMTISLGLALGRLLKTGRDTSVLVTVGTAICGGSAIAALAPAIRAKTTKFGRVGDGVFSYAVALLIFPAMVIIWAEPGAVRSLECIGNSRHQFGGRSGDAYGPRALESPPHQADSRVVDVPVTLAVGSM